MLVQSKNNLASRVLQRKDFTKGENSLFETLEPHKNLTAIGGQSEVMNLWITQEKR